MRGIRDRRGGGGILGRTLAAALLLGFLSPPAVEAGFRVYPVRVDLDRSSRSGAVTIANDGSEPLSFQLNAFAWSQDGEAKDKYRETADLVFFPKLFVVDPGGAQVVRVGTKLPSPVSEKTYRLHIAQMPEKNRGEGSQVSMLIRFELPVYIKPDAERVSGDLDEVAVAGGIVRALVRNTGNTHFRIEKTLVRGFDAGGKEIFGSQSPGWYLLEGASRPLEVPVPKEVCSLLSRVAIVVTTDRVPFEREATVQEGSCR